MISADDSEYEIREVEMIQVPSARNPNEWSQKYRCPVSDCRAWIWYDFMGFKLSSCRHNAGFKNGLLLLRIPREAPQ